MLRARHYLGWSTWTPDREYEIERVLSARRVGGGWQFDVKWKGYPTATPEPWNKLARRNLDQSIKDQMERCKADYLSTHPAEQTRLSTHETPAQPTRVLPQRQRDQTHRFVFHVTQLESQHDHPLLHHRLLTLRQHSKQRSAALQQFTPDFPNFAHVTLASHAQLAC